MAPLAGVVQPLAGEWAARRSLMESLSIPVGYGVELSTLLDTFAQHGLDALAQVDLGSRAHRHQADHDLALMAAELLAVAESRRPGRAARCRTWPCTSSSRRTGHGPGRWSARCPADERPPRRGARHSEVASRAASLPRPRPRPAGARPGALRLGRTRSGRSSCWSWRIVNRTPDSFYRPRRDLGRGRGHGPRARGGRRGRRHRGHRRRAGRARRRRGLARGDPPDRPVHRGGPRRLSRTW